MAQRTARTAPSAPTAPDQASSKGFILAIAAIVVVGLAAVAFFVSTRGEGAATAEAGEQTAPIEVSGEALAPMPAGVNLTGPDSDPSFGAVAPTLTGTTFDDEEVTITADGTPKAIYFLAHWCPHCQAEVPLVQGLIDAGRVPEGFEIYGVSTAVDRGRGNFPASTWLEEEGFTPTVIRDDELSSALGAYGNGGFPYVVYLDGENRVLARSAGELGGEAIAQIWAATAAGGLGS